jgi:hypothetical protein
MANNYDGKYRNFMFMAGWRDYLEGLVEDFGMEYAQEALWNLMLVATFDPDKQEGEQELTTTKKSIENFVRGCVEPVVKNSTANHNKNRENGSKGGRPKKQVDVELAFELYKEMKNWEKVAAKMEVSVQTLRDARREYEAAKNPKNPETEGINSEDFSDKNCQKPKNPEVFGENGDETNSYTKTQKTQEPIKYGEFIF